ncbi:XRE family transcriptional regulator [Listeria monocytogenes]|uniref:XRE family transcriptional regulator n=1 Tax=Listeria immobilis TaxID=2713502 RepID=A0ABR6SYJ1_9LIST|nr:helix-turn-helix domain-containing protein [Listeria immobilis]EAC4628510.1 XRE family transcriptional regulator [Listeria monocytogenes]EAC6356363.1 XRE family transcriptional regulator [Listeria monocytogenes]EAC7062892.1 XRE family transcriptional regulator [Listeria monocytogenes]EAD7040795.1 XRE family transcriptional regulator [Listeria monocytogenes]MBC1507382.1 XRE family transcriptional regulator [Listeria immobilis]
MAGFIAKFCEMEFQGTIYELSKRAKIGTQTLRDADKKEVDRITAKNVRRIAELFDYSPGQLLDKFYKIEKEFNKE